MRIRLILLLTLTLLIGCEKDNIDNKPSLPDINNPDNGNNDGDDKDKEPEGLAKQIAEANWETIQVAEGVVYKYHHFNNLFKSNQSISVIDIDLNKDITIDIPYVTTGFLKTSDAGINHRATAAINGSFFSTTKGGGTTFFRKNGEVINSTRSGFDAFRENAGFAVEQSGKVSIVKKPAGGWHSTSSNTLLASGPLLVYNNEVVEQLNKPFNTTRHPRTAVGVTSNNHLMAVVVDGRFNEAHGMSTTELSEFMNALGCVEAMNFDGGGSSTAWIRNRGVMNYPADNKKFDHEGERGVATVITFTAK